VTVTPNGTRQAWLRFFHLIRYIEPGVLCDLNVDGMVNNTDSSELDSLLGLHGINTGGLPTSPTWNTQADIYSDGRIDYKDWQTFSKVKAIPPKFTIEIIPGSQVVASKDAITFKAVIRNLGQLDIHDYTFSFKPAFGLSFKSSSEPVRSGQAITYSNPLLPAYQSKTIDLTFSLSPGMDIPQSGLTLTSSAQLTSLIDTLPIEASAKVGVPSLSIQLVSSAMKAQAGDKLTFTAVASNRSPYAVTNAVAWVDLPKELEFQSMSPQGTKLGNKIFYELGTMAPGANVSVKINAKLAVNASGNLSVLAGVSSGQTFEANDYAIVSIFDKQPGGTPELLIRWSGIDTKTSTGKAGEEIVALLSVTGGSSPYEAKLMWGDGSAETSIIKGAEAKEFKHTFTQPGRFEITVICTDSVMRQRVSRRMVEIR
jgi:uncharacterized repeat protein (TIGR01451 family)